MRPYFLLIFVFLLAACNAPHKYSTSYWQRPPQSLKSVDTADALQLLHQYKAFDFDKHPLTVGVEVEFITPHNVLLHPRLLLLAKQQVLNARGSTKLLKAAQAVISLMHESGYRFVKDPSIKAPLGFTGNELVSPVLYTEKDQKIFYQIVEGLKKKVGAVAAPLSAGTHVHVGFPDASEAELAFLSWLFQLLEKDIFASFQVNEKRKYFARPTEQGPQNETLKQIEKAKNDKDLKKNPQLDKPQDGFVDEDWSRYQALNLLSLNTHETVEFRFANSTLDVKKLKALIEFVSALVQAVRSQDPRLVQFLKGNTSNKHILRRLVKSLGLNLDFSLFQSTVELKKFLTLHDESTQAFLHGKLKVTSAAEADSALTSLCDFHDDFSDNEWAAAMALVAQWPGRWIASSHLYRALRMENSQRASELIVALVTTNPKNLGLYSLSYIIRLKDSKWAYKAVKAIANLRPEAIEGTHIYDALALNNSYGYDMVELLTQAQPQAAKPYHVDMAIEARNLQALKALVNTKPQVLHPYHIKKLKQSKWGLSAKVQKVVQSVMNNKCLQLLTGKY